MKGRFKSIDKDAPLSVYVLVKLFSVQSIFLLSEFNKKLAEQEKIISTQAESIQSLQSENEILRRDNPKSSSERLNHDLSKLIHRHHSGLLILSHPKLLL